MTWNPERWAWPSYDDSVARSSVGELVDFPWSSGNTRSIAGGDRLFLLRQSTDRGLIASGFAISDVYPDTHWNPERSDPAHYVRVRFDRVLPIPDVLPLERLADAVGGVHWNRVQASGISVPEEAAPALEQLWQNHLQSLHRRDVPFLIGALYTRRDIYEILQVPADQQRGDWDTGYHRHEDNWFIFATVGAAGRTGHEYGNYWDGDELVWRGRNGSRLDQPRTQALLAPAGNVFVFTRSEDRRPFTFEGCATAAESLDTTPVTIRWRFRAELTYIGKLLPEEAVEGGRLTEGAVRTIQVNAYERNREARRRCIAHYGATCQVCGFDFRRTYGEIGEGFIHVHHVRELASIGEEYVVEPIADLRPVCPNCHAMLHTRIPALTIDDLRRCLHLE